MFCLVKAIRAAHRSTLWAAKRRRRYTPTATATAGATISARLAAIYHDDLFHFGPCGKIKHSSRSAAKRHAKAVRKNDNRERAELVGVYWCGRCGAWHVGHSRPTEGRRAVGGGP